MTRRRGFTLVELMVVVVIIGIILTLVVKAYLGSLKVAQEKATIALIAKLDQAMQDRLEAVLTYPAQTNRTHYLLSGLWPVGASIEPNTGEKVILDTKRAQVIAQYDYLRAQLPDVFVPQTNNANYPINFAGTAFGPGTDDYAFQLPLGNSVVMTAGGCWDGNAATLTPGTGIYGASYEIAAGIYKQLGYGPKGYDGSDNDGDGLVDELDESGLTAANVAAKLGRHNHKTARAEMLYAILVEGGGTFGSSFDKDDFTSKEVQDTDGDGLMEFVDAWGEPLQFYRWPILYRSDSQKGFPDVATLALGQGPYASAFESREQSPIDPNQNLLSPSWWGLQYNSNAPWPTSQAYGNISKSAAYFMDHFGPCLVDPFVLSQGTPAPSPSSYWDRSASPNPPSTGPLFYRRAYYSRFLILSAGPDKLPGTAMLDTNYKTMDDRDTIETPAGTVSGRDGSGVGATRTVQNLLIESQGGKVDPTRVLNTFGKLSLGANGRNDTNSQFEYYGQDDITNHTLQTPGGALK